VQLELKDRTAVVFAASKGLGRATAEALAAEGCRVAICSRSKENIEATAEQIRSRFPTDIICSVTDVEKAADIDRFLSKVINRWGKIDILVNNAGGPPVKSFEETDDQEWLKYFNITFMSVVRAVRKVVPLMKQNKWGRIINITSVSVKEPIKGLIYSNALRLAIVGLAKSLADELGPFGITVHNVAPGYHRTDGLQRIVIKRVENGEKEEDIFRQWEQSVPLRRIGEARELAALITFLASEKSGYMTGSTIAVDGGRYRGTM
jgi:3-oxoacyl-[acyl-carrier protein] reductase